HSPTSTLFPYTTLFRSRVVDAHGVPDYHAAQGRAGPVHGGRRRAVVDLVVRDRARHGEALGGDVGGEPGRIGHLVVPGVGSRQGDRKSTRLNSSHVSIS